MKENSAFLDQYSLLTFLILTPLISLSIPLILPLSSELVPLLMVFIPALMAITLTALTGGRKGVDQLLRKLFQWRIGFRWYKIAFVIALGLRLSMSVLALTLGWIPAIRFNARSPAEFILLAVFIVIGAVTEELGWRGYVLPKLLAYRSGLFSALVIGIIWGAIHLGLILPGQMNAGTHWLPTILYIIGLSVILTWLYIQTRGSLVAPILFHAGQSIFVFINGGITPTQQLLLLVVVAAAASLLLILFFGVNLQRGPVQEPAIVDAG